MTDANDKLPQTTERNPSPQPSSTESQTSFSSKIKNMNCSQVYIFIVNNFPLILYSITTILLFADQNLLAPNLTAIATEFGFTDIERDTKLGGDIAVAFFLLGAPASFIVGCLGDIYPRTPLFVLTVYIGEGACAATYWTRTYSGLYICRALTGFSIGGALPLIYSLLGDLYPADKRNGVSALVTIGMGTGIAIGQGIAGYLGPTFGWRLPFLVVSIPALITASLVGIYISEPERGSTEKALLEQNTREPIIPVHGRNSTFLHNETPSYEHVDQNKNQETLVVHDLRHDSLTKDGSNVIHSSSTNDGKSCIRGVYGGYIKTFQSTMQLIRTKSVLLLLLQGVPGCIPWGVVNTYLNDYLSEDQGMSIEAATTTILVFGIGNFFGILMGGYFGDRLYSRSPAYPALLAGSAAIAGCLPFWVLLNHVTSSSPLPFACFVSIVAGVLVGVTGPIVKATLTNVTDPMQRSQAFALFTTFNDLGSGLGPFFVSNIIVWNQGSRQRAFNYGISAWLACGFTNLLVYFTVIADEDEVQKRISTRIAIDNKDEKESHNSNDMEAQII